MQKTSLDPRTVNIGDRIEVGGLPATVIAVYLDRIAYRYTAEAPRCAGLCGVVGVERPLVLLR